MDDCRRIAVCRICGGELREVLDLGTQCLGGQFPLQGEPDPPAFPLVLCRCVTGCGLVQLGHTVNPELMFSHYGYRSSVTRTMTEHLRTFALEASMVLGRDPDSVLDIGGNDGTLAEHFRDRAVVVDPSDVPSSER